jgi:hypothetical protein
MSEDFCEGMDAFVKVRALGFKASEGRANRLPADAGQQKSPA